MFFEKAKAKNARVQMSEAFITSVFLALSGGFQDAEIRDMTGADSLDFLSLDNLQKLAPNARCGFCEGCFTEHYPIPVDGTAE